ncbi:hypothetical protein HMPREF3166_01060 [Corynebacterium sp. HMSC08A12]|uniref:Ltp family lipoprotein n=1 Tax=Corynebacterium sp. HMSC08A12 TaxID=1581134 RepID=UPI0008A2FA67|nr:Ltp family lipoprotein [Corynebacterium sp. HMSC08A12]OFT36450.1 hypothetical protein HMPREF3166_01060 [Corynebacterium sp. HMSC08A12]
MPSPDNTPQRDSHADPQKDALQDPINGRLALIFIGAIVLVGLLVAAIWYVANNKDYGRGINPQPAAASAHQRPASTSATEPANAPVKASNAPQSELNQYSTSESEATGSTAMESTESTAIAQPTDAPKTQRQANDAAMTALKFNLSEKGLRENLQLQGYSDDQITTAINKLDPDWNQQALNCARKLNESGSPLPEDQLLEILKTNSGFTEEQAQYAIDRL